MVRVATIIGARPQFVKSGPISAAIADAEGIHEETIHTGQHFDANMSDIFFQDLGLPHPRHQLEIHGGHHGDMTARMLVAIERILLDRRPTAVLIYGDTNSTLAGALAACKLSIPVVHVEAGLRSYNRAMPEEINRVLSDHASDLLLCPTQQSIDNLSREGITRGVHHVGDVMHDATLQILPVAERRSDVLDRLDLSPRSYAVATVHRAENTASSDRLEAAVGFLASHAGDCPIVFPVHPRTKAAAEQFNVSLERDGLILVEPLGYLDMTKLVHHACAVYTDSGGLQKEAYFHRAPCVTMRDETEWTETVEHGWNRLWTIDRYAPRREITEYGDGTAASKIVDIIRNVFSKQVQ